MSVPTCKKARFGAVFWEEPAFGAQRTMQHDVHRRPPVAFPREIAILQKPTFPEKLQLGRLSQLSHTLWDCTTILRNNYNLWSITTIRET